MLLPLWQNGESFHLFVIFLSPFSVEGDRFWSPKGDEKFTHKKKPFTENCDNFVTKW
jgi:hypothetical protein